MDLVHILAFQTLKFWKSLRQSNNTTIIILSYVLVGNVIIWYYWEHIHALLLISLAPWSVRFLSIIPVSVLHVSYWLFFFFFFCAFVCCLSFICCVGLLLPTWRINVFIISCRRQCCRFRHNNSVGVDTGFVAHRLCDCVNTTTDQIQTSQATDRWPPSVNRHINVDFICVHIYFRLLF